MQITAFFPPLDAWQEEGARERRKEAKIKVIKRRGSRRFPPFPQLYLTTQEVLIREERSIFAEKWRLPHSCVQHALYTPMETLHAYKNLLA